MSFLHRWFRKPQPIRSIPEFWNWFQGRQARLHGALLRGSAIDAEVLEPVLDKLGQVQEGIYAEAGMKDAHTAEIIFTAQGNIRHFAFIEDLVAAAPSLPGWTFTALKPPVDAAGLKIGIGDHQIEQSDLHFYPIVHVSRPDEIHIVVVHEGFTEANAVALTQGIYLYLDRYLGELNFAITIDNLTITGNDDGGQERIPIGKLRDYLCWRQKEFEQKYEAVERNTEEDRFSVARAESQDGNTLVLLANTALFGWDCKATHPWILKLEIGYDPQENGLPTEPVRVKMDALHEQMTALLSAWEGNLFVVRNTGEGKRTAYFACRDFRSPSRVLARIEKDWAGELRMDADLYQDKYWQTFPSYQFQ